MRVSFVNAEHILPSYILGLAHNELDQIYSNSLGAKIQLLLAKQFILNLVMFVLV
ncbi:hypothetical protein GLIP_2106 [Aliiglaciecola lipolytica E3]|uniref:Uncharacterized protein n=1 Tax=Aliiglaciecola lipolytica E3 TaxID=1127673 RepID=K6X246_9ALTE|nr:hypothetical protein GLIP_2106 [Aliiglaciecola lipolytica E3]